MRGALAGGRAVGAALAAILVAALFVLAPPAARAEESLRPYTESSDLLATTPSTDDGAIGALYNPAQWGVPDRPEFTFFWSDAHAAGGGLENWGLAAGQGLGYSMRRTEVRTPSGPRRVTDYELGAGFGSGAHYGGLALGFSGPGKAAFGRVNHVTLGDIWRPTRWLSYGTSTQFALGDEDIQGVADVGIRPLADPRVLLFADYALRRSERWDEGALAGGVALRPVPGLLASARWGQEDRLQVTVGVTIGRGGFRATPRFDRDGNRGATQYAIRNGAPVRGFDLDRLLHHGRRTLSLNWNGRVVYQSYRFFDDGSLPLRDLTRELQFAIDDPTVGAVTIQISGFRANGALTWELREKILEVRHAGKRVTVIADRLDARGYYLATAADHIVLDPRGSFLMPGVLVSRTYLHDLLGKVGLGFDEWRLYKYKSAAETLSRDRMSDADREQWTAIVGAAYDEVKRGVVESGRATAEQFDRVVNEEPYLSPNRLLELKWVDELGRWEDVESAAKDRGRGAAPATYASLHARREMPDETWGRAPEIALVYLVGDCSMDEGIRARESSRAMRGFREDSGVKAMVLRVDSPGGDPLASDVVADESRRARAAHKTVLVSQGRVAASGGYWISMDADQISATPFTLTGSIGVIGGWVWNDGLGKKLGLTSDKVQIGKSADLLGGLRIPIFGVTLPERNLDGGERRLIDRTLADIYDDFTKGVAAGRGIDLAEVRRIAEGRVYDGRAAATLKLVDRIATLDQTIDEAKRRAGLAKGARVRVVEYPRRPLLRLPSFLGRARIGSGGPVGTLGSPGPADAGRGDAGSVLPTYEARTLQWILDRPGQPLLMTPGTLLPSDESAFP